MSLPYAVPDLRPGPGGPVSASPGKRRCLPLAGAQRFLQLPLQLPFSRRKRSRSCSNCSLLTQLLDLLPQLLILTTSSAPLLLEPATLCFNSGTTAFGLSAFGHAIAYSRR